MLEMPGKGAVSVGCAPVATMLSKKAGGSTGACAALCRGIWEMWVAALQRQNLCATWCKVSSCSLVFAALDVLLE